jgi:hypothetical protein
MMHLIHYADYLSTDMISNEKYLNHKVVVYLVEIYNFCIKLISMCGFIYI